MTLAFESLDLPERHLEEPSQVLGRAGGVNRLVSPEPKGIERRRDRIGEAALLPHLLEEARGHAAAEHDVEQVDRETPLGGLRGAFDAEAHVRLLEAPPRLQEEVLVAARTRGTLGSGARGGDSGGASPEELLDLRQALPDPDVADREITQCSPAVVSVKG